MSVIDIALAAGLNAALAVHGRTITYTRDTTSLTVTAMRGRHRPTDQQPLREDQTAELELIDWICRADDLADLPDPTSTPDTVVCDGERYTVQAIASDCETEAWEWMTPDRTWVRIHTIPEGPSTTTTTTTTPAE